MQPDRTYLDWEADELVMARAPRPRPNSHALPPGTVIFQPDEVIAAVARYFKVQASLLKSADRTRHVSEARDAVYWLLRRHTRMGFQELAHTLKRKDHTGPLHAVRRAEERRETDAWYCDKLDRLERELEAKTKEQAA